MEKTTSYERTLRWRGEKISAAVAILALTLMGCETQGKSTVDILPRQTESPRPERQLPNQREKSMLDNVQIAIVGDTFSDTNPKHDKDSILDIFKEADNAIEQATNNQISLPDAQLVASLSLQPAGKIDGSDCYTHEQLLEADNAFGTDGVILILNESKGCLENEASGWQYGGTKTAVIGLNGLSVDTVTHEVGHMMGMDHHSEVRCQLEIESSEGRKDISELLQYPNCGITKKKNKDGKWAVDEYASRASVMGSAESRRTVYEDIFHPLELHVAKPQLFRYEAAKPGVYELRGTGEGLRGVELELPADHPLRRFDKSADKLVISASMQYGSPREINVLTDMIGKDMSYSLNVYPGATICLDDDCVYNTERRIVYRDRSLGIEVYAAKGEGEHVNLEVVSTTKE